MVLEDGIFPFGQRAGLAQDRLRHCDLTHIVQGGGHPQGMEVRGVEAECPPEAFGMDREALTVSFSIRVFRLDRAGEADDDRLAIIELRQQESLPQRPADLQREEPGHGERFGGYAFGFLALKLTVPTIAPSAKSGRINRLRRPSASSS